MVLRKVGAIKSYVHRISHVRTDTVVVVWVIISRINSHGNIVNSGEAPQVLLQSLRCRVHIDIHDNFVLKLHGKHSTRSTAFKGLHFPCNAFPRTASSVQNNRRTAAHNHVGKIFQIYMQIIANRIEAG